LNSIIQALFKLFSIFFTKNSLLFDEYSSQNSI